MRRTPVCVFIVMVTIIAFGCNRSETSHNRTHSPTLAPLVTVATVTTTNVAQTVERVARTHATQDVEIKARVEGFLAGIEFREGGFVKKDALLFVLEQAPYKTEVRRIKAELAKSFAERKKARADLKRLRDLRGRDSISQAALDEAIASAEKAAAEVLAKEAALERARLDLNYTEIRAPFDGRIGKSEFSVGDVVNSDSGPLTTVVALDPMFVYWDVSEHIVMNYRRQMGILLQEGSSTIKTIPRLRFPDGTFYQHEGRIDFLDNRVDPATGTQRVRAVFPNPDSILLPGQYLTIVIQIGESSDRLIVPQSAAQQDQDGYYVLVVDAENKVVVRRVALGERRGIHWIVEDGLTAGENVIYQGIQKVKPGMVVKPMVKQPDAPSIG